jgi:hypothetical protein
VTDEHDECLAVIHRWFRDTASTEIYTIDDPDHICVWFNKHPCDRHERGIWVHPTDRQFSAWQVQHAVMDSRP